METSPPPRSAIDLMPTLYYQLVYTLMDMLPPPLDDTPAGVRARNLTAIAKVASLAPVNADEADIASHCIASRAQAEEMLRLVRKNDHDPELMVKLNKQYASMMRLWMAVHARLRQAQAERRKRDADPVTENADAWARYIAERSMLDVVLAQPEAEPVAAPVAAPVKAPAAAPAARANPGIEQNVSENATNSHDVAFETPLSGQIPTSEPAGSRVENFRRILLETMRPFREEAEKALGLDGTKD